MSNKKLNDAVKSYNSAIAKELDRTCIEFLKSKGYTPKLTEKYMISLRKELEEKGLGLRPVYKYSDNLTSENMLCGNASASIYIYWEFYDIYTNERAEI